ncbi:S-adenosyl-L-methionine-dependent methyltransferase [Thozetella sp. PMI_491]|nr:S-adenosyl-L-methionine-dependent methyltransferase [Thozetella sp. PMI_491]
MIKLDTESPTESRLAPSLDEENSAREEEEDQNDASEQAEENAATDSSALGSDVGYQSDSESAASTSLAGSVLDYPYENGRRYHRFLEGRYAFPNDEPEQEREDLKHYCIVMLCDKKLFFAPIGDQIQRILDIGTGTGAWAIDMGDQFPTAFIEGIDLSPHQPGWVPPNVRFVVDDAESPWVYPPGHFDYIHSLYTIIYLFLGPDSIRHLQPGGWLEIQEVYHYPMSVEGRVPMEHPIATYWNWVTQALNTLGIQLQAAGTGYLPNAMRNAGFLNVTERVIQLPIGTWPTDRTLKTVGLCWRNVLLDGIYPIAIGPLTRAFGWSRQQVELFLVQVREAYQNARDLSDQQMHMEFHVIYGQKPV